MATWLKLEERVAFHFCVIDGVFAAGEDGELRFAEATLTPEDVAAVQQQVRARVLRCRESIDLVPTWACRE